MGTLSQKLINDNIEGDNHCGQTDEFFLSAGKSLPKPWEGPPGIYLRIYFQITEYLTGRLKL